MYNYSSLNDSEQLNIKVLRTKVAGCRSKSYSMGGRRVAKTAEKIKRMIREIVEGKDYGIGKPEPLKGNLSGYWSRRINKKDRLIYNSFRKV